MEQNIKQKKRLLSIALLFAVVCVHAQSDTLYISGQYEVSDGEQWYGNVELAADASLYIPDGANALAYGATLTARSGAKIYGANSAWTATPLGSGTGAVVFTAPNPNTNVTAQQTVDGGNIGGAGSTFITASNIFTSLTFNNTAGVNLANTATAVGSNATFRSGQITTQDATTPLIFGENATAVNPSDASHVNGYVQSQGATDFVYPTGDGSRYEKVETNLSANAGGLEAIYYPKDTAAANGYGQPLSAASGLDKLKHYNTLEYWDLTPVSSATGTVTVYWDNYKNVGIASANDLVVAHQTGGYWEDDGVQTTGVRSGSTASSGSVTSMTETTWSPFTLGSLADESPLPVTLLYFTATAQGKTALLNWETATEINSKGFGVQRSADRQNWQTLGFVNSKANDGNSSQPLDYDYTDNAPLAGINYYRLQEQSNDGSTSGYSDVASVNFGAQATIYPNPATTQVNVTVAANSDYQLVNMLGNVVQRGNLNAGKNIISVMGMPSGTYILRVIAGNSATSYKLIIDK